VADGRDAAATWTWRRPATGVDPGLMDAKSTTVVRHPPALLAAVWAGLPALGGTAGWFLPDAVAWAAGLPWAPWQGLLRAAGGLPEPALSTGSVAVGAVAGLLLAAALHDEALTVTVTGGQVVLRNAKGTTSLDRGDAADAFVEDDHLVLLAADGRELARTACLLPADRLARALGGAGLAWHDGDPYAEEYRRWVPGTPGLPPGADALLTARAGALQDGDGREREELRAELVRIGVVVRDRSRKQHVRVTPRRG
jgi:hypothetical protein